MSCLIAVGLHTVISVSVYPCVCPKTADGVAKRYYSFALGKTKSKGAEHAEPTMAIVFESATVAMGLIRTMAKNPKDPSVFMVAMQQGKLKMEGDMSLMMWFMQIAKHFGPQKNKSLFVFLVRFRCFSCPSLKGVNKTRRFTVA